MDKYRMVVDGDDWHELNSNVTRLTKELEKANKDIETLQAKLKVAEQKLSEVNPMLP